MIATRNMTKKLMQLFKLCFNACFVSQLNGLIVMPSCTQQKNNKTVHSIITRTVHESLLTKAERLYTISFDGVYTSSVHSSPIFTLNITNT